MNILDLKKSIVKLKLVAILQYTCEFLLNQINFEVYISNIVYAEDSQLSEVLEKKRPG